MEEPRLASARLHADIDRLRAQVDLSWTKEADALAQLGLSDGMSILEVGSGPGFVTERLLGALPNSTVTCVELDPVMIKFAARQLARHCDRLDIVESSILQTDLPSDEFDFALVRFVLQHVAAPDMALMEVLRLLKRRATVAVLDVDDGLGGLMVPHLPAFANLGQKVRQVQAAHAGDREIGRKLWRLLAQVGFVDVGLQPLLLTSDEVGLAPFAAQYAPERYRPFIEAGAMTSAELEDYRAACTQLFASPDALIMQLYLLASARKPETS